MLSSFQRHTLGYDRDVQTAVTASYRLVPPLDVTFAVRTWWFPASAGYGRATLIGPGARLWFLESGIGAALVEATLGLGLNGSNTRFMFDAGAGYGFHASEALDVGPVVRYGQVLAADGDDPESAKFWSFGVFAIYRFGGGSTAAPAPAAAAPAATDDANAGSGDRDEDGVDDLHDACPDVPKGPKPNPDQLGCPDADFDKDGVVDHEDQCPAEALGLHPDPARRGCPLADRDGDSVPDVDDRCPDKAGAPSPDLERNGCPGPAKAESKGARHHRGGAE